MADNTQSFVRDPPITGASFTPTLKLQSQIPGAIPNKPISTFAFNAADTIFTGDTIFTNPICIKEIRLKENLATDAELQLPTTNYLALKAPDILTANTTWTLPPSDGLTGQLINTDGSGNLGFVTAGSGDISSTGNLSPITLTQADGIKSISSTNITVANNDELNNVQEINLLADVNSNTWYGSGTGGFNVLSQVNCAFGNNAMANASAMSGDDNCAFGRSSLQSITSGSNNVGFGGSSLLALTSGSGNTALGVNSGFQSTESNNTYIGFGAGFNIRLGSDNTFLGNFAGGTISGFVVPASNNICIGNASGNNLTGDDSDNIIIGSRGVVADSNVIRIGTAITQTSCFIQGIHSITPSGATQTVIIDASGELGSAISSGAEGSTGVLAGGLITINADPTLFDISDGSGIIFNTTTLTATAVTWTNLTGQSTTYVGDETFISVDSTGSLVFSVSLPTNSATRDNIYLGQIVHLDQINIVATLDEQVTLLSHTNQIRDFMQAIGELNIDGNVMSSNNLLTITKTAGRILKFGANYINDINDPHLPISAALDTNVADIFAYRWQDGSIRLSLTDVVGNEFDNGGGESSPGTVMANQWSVQRIFTFSIGAVVIQQAQFVYGNKSDAISAIETEGFIIEPDLAVSGVLIAFLAIKGNVSDLSTLADAEFLQAGKFGGSSTGATGESVASSLVLADNSIVRGDGGARSVQDSGILIDDSNNLTGVNDITIGGTINMTGSSSGVVTIGTAAVAGTWTMTLPVDDGNNLEFLQTNGSGVLSWAASGGGGGAGATIRHFQASDLLNPSDVSYSVNIVAPTIPDPIFGSLQVRAFDQTVSEAVAGQLYIPSGVTSIDVSISFRRSASAGGSIRFDLLTNDLNSGTVVAASWDVGNIIYNATPASTQVVVKTTTNFTLAALGLTADEACLFEIVRNIVDTAAHDVYLISVAFCIG